MSIKRVNRYNNVYLNLSKDDLTQQQAYDFLQLITRSHLMNKFLAKLIVDCVKQYSDMPIEQLSKEAAKEIVQFFLSNEEVGKQSPLSQKGVPTLNANDMILNLFNQFLESSGSQVAAIPSSIPAQTAPSVPVISESISTETSSLSNGSKEIVPEEEIDFSSIPDEDEDDMEAPNSTEANIIDGMEAFGVFL